MKGGIMNSLIEKKYISKIKANKDLLISELTDEFGIQYKELLEERFDKINFIFFVSIENFANYISIYISRGYRKNRKFYTCS